MSIFSFYKLANTENGYHLVKDLVTFFSALLPMLSMTLSKHFMSVFVILDTGSKISTDGDYASVQMHKIKRRNLFYSILLWKEGSKYGVVSWILSILQPRDAGTSWASPTYSFCVQPEPLYTCPFGDNWENSTGNILCRCSVYHLPILYFTFQYAVTQSFAIPCVPPALTTRRRKSQSIFTREYKDLASVDRWILQWANLFMPWFSTEKEIIYIYILLVSYFFN